jgi:RNA polymerase sigma-70 factor (ECF subfamily)
MGSYGFTSDDWDDLRQELLLDCWRRLPRFDAARGPWQGFVRGLIRNRSCVLVTRQARRRQFEQLGGDGEQLDGSEELDHQAFRHRPELRTPNPCFGLELRLDIQRVLAGLPEPLRVVASQLAETTIADICRRTGRSRSSVNHMVLRIRSAFRKAGITPATIAGAGGAQ